MAISDLLKNAVVRVRQVVLEAISSKKFLVMAGATVLSAAVFPKLAMVMIGVWLLCQTAVDIAKVIMGEEGEAPKTLAERFQAGVVNVIGGLLGSKKALVTGGTATILAAIHPAWAMALVAEWLLCQTAIDVVLVVKKRK